MNLFGIGTEIGDASDDLLLYLTSRKATFNSRFASLDQFATLDFKLVDAVMLRS